MTRLSLSGIISSFDNINFEPETDCKSAFSVEKAFHAFRHQRDLFYELYNNWKSSQSHASFSSTLNPNGVKSQFELSIIRLVSLSHDASNMYHLSKLFVSQLIRTCVMGGTKKFLSNDHPDQFLSSIQNDKLRKLRKRVDHADFKPPSTFNDEERFFYEFIVTMKDQSFHRYLQLMLIQKIKETNDCLPVSGEADEYLVVSEKNNVKHQFTTLSLTLQVLAKFLGLVVFLPYQMDKSSSLQFIETQVSLRKDDVCCINFVELIRKASEMRKLSLTLPWILQFLRQMDSISPRLKCYREIIKTISKVKENLVSNKFKCDANTRAHLIHIIDSFIDDYKDFKYLETGSGIDCSSDTLIINFDEYHGLIDEDYTSSGVNPFPSNMTSPQKTTCISPQKDINRLTPRKIRPTTLTNVKNDSSSRSNPNRQLQFHQEMMESSRDLVRELENDFLSLHPMSMVKVIELVSDRVYSRCVKQLRHSVIQQARESITDPESFESDGTVCLNRKHTVDTIRVYCSKFAHDFCTVEIPKILPMLLSEHDYTKDTVNFAAKLTIHKSCEKCCQWIIGNINPQGLLNFFKHSAPISDAKLERDIDISGPFGSIRDLIKDLLLNKNIDMPQFTTKIETLMAELTNLRKSNLPEKFTRTIDSAIWDSLISVIARLPHECNESTINCWINYCITFNVKVNRFVCPRNLSILNYCPNSNASWDKFIFVLNKLINCDLYPLKFLQFDCLSTLKQIEHKNLGFFKSSLKDIIHNQRKKSTDGNVLNDLSKYFDQLDDIDFPRLA